MGFPETADAHLRFMKEICLQHPLQCFRVNPVVAVQKHEPPALTVVPDPVQACISGRRQAPVFLVDHMDSFVSFRISVADPGTAVRAAVIHQNQLQIPKGLAEHAVCTAAQISLYPVDRDDNTDHCQFRYLIRCFIIRVPSGRFGFSHIAFPRKPLFRFYWADGRWQT